MKSSTETASPPEFKSVPLGSLVESKTNPRKSFDKKLMEDLVFSIEEKGILEPLLVRPVNGHLEILAGARRFRAATAAGFKEVPVIIRELTDDQAREVEVIDNLQREDIHPLDEAEGYALLIKLNKYDAPTIAAKVGKDPSYIYKRMKLSELIQPAKKMLRDEVMHVGHAELIARLGKDQQSELIKNFKYNRPGSVADLRAMIVGRYLLNLSRAPWKKDDAELVPAAGACKTCPKRSGFNRELFSDIQKDDLCADSTCFNSKLQAFIDRRRHELKEKGEKFIEISGDNGYSLNRPKGVLAQDEYRTPAEGCKSATLGLIVHGRDIGALKKICHDPKCKACTGSTRSSGSGEKWKKRAAAERAKLETERQFRYALFNRVTDKAPEKLSSTHLRMVGRLLIDRLDYDSAKRLTDAIGLAVPKGDYSGGHATALLKALCASDVATAKTLYLISMCGALDPGRHSKDHLKQLISQAKALGINPEKVRRETASKKKSTKPTTKKKGRKK